MVTFILRNESFLFNGIFFEGIRGLALGSKISPILVMNQLERSTFFQETILNPVTFFWYIDDCVLINERDADLDNTGITISYDQIWATEISPSQFPSGDRYIDTDFGDCAFTTQNLREKIEQRSIYPLSFISTYVHQTKC